MDSINGFETNGIRYQISTSNKSMVEVDCRESKYTGDIVIPRRVKYNGVTYRVTGIGRGAFRGCEHLMSVTIPNSVTRIESETFYGSSRLKHIIIPDSVRYIGNYAFLGCTSLASIRIPYSDIYIGDGAFAGCFHLTVIQNIEAIPTERFPYLFQAIKEYDPTLTVPAKSTANAALRMKMKVIVNALDKLPAQCEGEPDFFQLNSHECWLMSCLLQTRELVHTMDDRWVWVDVMNEIVHRYNKRLGRRYESVHLAIQAMSEMINVDRDCLDSNTYYYDRVLREYESLVGYSKLINKIHRIKADKEDYLQLIASYHKEMELWYIMTAAIDRVLRRYVWAVYVDNEPITMYVDNFLPFVYGLRANMIYEEMGFISNSCETFYQYSNDGVEAQLDGLIGQYSISKEEFIHKFVVCKKDYEEVRKSDFGDGTYYDKLANDWATCVEALSEWRKVRESIDKQLCGIDGIYLSFTQGLQMVLCRGVRVVSNLVFMDSSVDYIDKTEISFN